MLTQLLGGDPERFEALVLDLALEIAAVDLLQDYCHAPVSMNQVEGEVGGVQPGFFLVQIQDFVRIVVIKDDVVDPVVAVQNGMATARTL